MTETNPRDILEKTLTLAKAKGADQAEAVFYSEDGISVSVRLGALEDVEQPATQRLGVRVFSDGKTTSLSTSDLEKHALETMVEKAVQIARQGLKDPHRGLAGPDQFFKGKKADLEVFDPAEPAVDKLKALALGAEDAGRALKGITNSEGASAGYIKKHRAHMTTSGFFGETRSSSFSFYTVLLAGEGTRMERDYEFSTKRFFSDLDDPGAVGKKAAERTLKRLNPRKIKSQKAPVIFHNRVANTLVSHFAGAINGKPVAKGTTFLTDKMDQAVFGPGITIVDDPAIKRGLGSRSFDSEGLPIPPLNLVENGTLKTWLLDIASANELGLSSNGRSARSLAGTGGPSTTNLYMEKGSKTVEDLMAGAGEGLLVTDLIGMGVNPVTGDYSRGASGFWFEKGAVAYPVSEITIAGNLKDMFFSLIPANDLIFKQTANAPSVLIPDMMVAGT